MGTTPLGAFFFAPKEFMADAVETVVAETPVAEAPTGKDAFAAARKEIRARAQSTDQGAGEESPASDPPPAPDKPAQQTEKPADEPPVTGETEDALLPPDEVSKLSAGDRKLYEKAQKAFTQKTQKIAAERKEFETLRQEFDKRKPLIDALDSDPDGTLEYLAKQRGMKIVKADQDTKVVEQKTQETLAALPQEWQFLAPVFDSYGKQVRDAVMASIQTELEPIKQQQLQATSQAVAAETNSNVEAFTAKHPGWKVHEPKMLELAQQFVPATAMDPIKYMETLLTLVTAGATEADKTRDIVKAINKVVENTEPATQGVDSTRVEHVMPKGLDNSSKRFRAAAQAARRGERWTVTD